MKFGRQATLTISIFNLQMNLQKKKLNNLYSCCQLNVLICYCNGVTIKDQISIVRIYSTSFYHSL